MGLAQVRAPLLAILDLGLPVAKAMRHHHIMPALESSSSSFPRMSGKQRKSVA
jgi:hypothetical protein